MGRAFFFLLSVMAVFRLSAMLATEAGPFRIFERLRKLPAGRTAREGLGCPLCESVWWGFICAVYLRGVDIIATHELVLWWLAISGGAVIAWRQWPKQS